MNLIKELFKSRFFLLGCGICMLFCAGVYFYVQWDLARFEAQFRPPPAPETKNERGFVPPVAPAPGFAPPAQTEAPENGDAAQPALSNAQLLPPPGAVLKPVFPEAAPNEDPIKAAYKRLEYIKNNPYAWGGVFSPRATELISELMPPPVLRDPAHVDEVELLIEELIEQDDPRAAKVLIANMCEGYIGGRRMFEAVIEIGPPAVLSALIYLNNPYLHAENVSINTVVRLLGEIAEQHRGDLGGIVDHILIPKFKNIAADEKLAKSYLPAVEEAREFLDRLHER